MSKINSRAKGKRGERYFLPFLQKHFPNVKINRLDQAAEGGPDYRDTDEFDFEAKCGKPIVKTEQWVSQAINQGEKFNLKVVLFKPDRKEPYVLIPLDDFGDLLKAYLAYTRGD